MIKLFHITTANNARRILAKGFEGEFFATDKRDLGSWILAFIADRFEAGKFETAVVLSFDVSKDQIIERNFLPNESRHELLVEPPVRQLRIVRKIDIRKQARGITYTNVGKRRKDKPIIFGRKKTSVFARK